jgi:alcohol dehydrogenase
MDVTKFAIPEIICGKNSLETLIPCVQRNGGSRVLLVSDPGLEEAGWVHRVIDLLDQAGVHWVYFDEVDSNPRDYQVHKGAEFYLRQRADVVLALGGGSPMDLAKGIAMVASNGGRVQDYEGANRIRKPLPPMIFIPSTAGSGADISQFAIITDMERGVKMSIISRTLTPDIAIIDPSLLQTKPEWLIIASAVDALAHAAEAYCSPISSPFTAMHALQSIRTIMENLLPAVQTRSCESLTNLSTASTTAAMAFSNAGLGVDHAIAHALGGMFDVLHGLVHPVLLPTVMRFNLPEAEAKMADIGKAVIGRRLATNRETAEEGIRALEEFFGSLNIPLRLRNVLGDSSRLPEISRLAVQDACMLSNPREATWRDCLAICEEAW